MLDPIRNHGVSVDTKALSCSIADKKSDTTQAIPTDTVSSGETPEKRGLVLMQIDGLSHKALKYAMEEGYAPNIASLINDRNYTLSPYQCGIATVTMPVLAALFYGTEMPGNDWYDKKTDKFIEGSEYEPKLQKELAARGEEGILSKGVVFSSPMDGGAKETYLTVSTLKKNREEKGTVRTLLEEAKKDFKMLRKGGYSLTRTAWNTIKDIYKARTMMKSGGVANTTMDKLAPILMALNHNVFEKVAGFGMIDAMNRGIPVMYTDFAAYDEKAHYFGPMSGESMDMLKTIDEEIGRVAEAAKNSPDKYEILIFSDHGQTPSKLFHDLYGKKAEDLVLDYAREAKGPGKDLGEREVVFTDAYSLGNIYFNYTKGQADISGIESRYPGMFEKLVEHPGIGLVCGREGDRYVFKGKEGSLSVSRDGTDVRVEGENPLVTYGDEKVLLEQVNNYMEVRGSGDVVIFGRYDREKDEVVDFNKKYSLTSLHGGLGGDQTEPFIVSDPSLPINGGEITEASQFHDLHKKYREYLKGWGE